MTKNLVILGSTGSIGTQALEVVDALGSIRVVGLAAGRSIDRLEQQIRKYRPLAVAVTDLPAAEELKRRLLGESVRIFSGPGALEALARWEEADTVLVAVAGKVGLAPTLAAIRAGKTIALANKETLVSGGELVTSLVKQYGVKLLPVDSEHSAIFQSLQGNEGNPVERILLTASGGPFRGKTRSALENVTAQEALKHPNWSMGPKVTIDSSTLMNKGLEVMEARWLFDVPPEKIQVLIHPQSIVHSGVEYADGAVMAQLGCPDMRLPIQYALTWPRRLPNSFPRLNLFEVGTLTFEEPDRETFPCLELAYQALRLGGTAPAVLNAANEAAVGYFLQNRLRYLDIPRLIADALAAYTNTPADSLESLLRADAWGTAFAADWLRQNH